MIQWVYLLTFDDPADRGPLLDFLDTLDDVKNWHAPLGAAVFVVTSLTATRLSNLILPFFQDRSTFFVTDVTKADRNGRLTVQTWDFLKNPGLS